MPAGRSTRSSCRGSLTTSTATAGRCARSAATSSRRPAPRWSPATIATAGRRCARRTADAAPWLHRTSYRSSMRHAATVLPALVAAALLAPAAPPARVVLVATGDGAATLTDVATNQVVARIPVGGRTRATAAAPDGSRGYVA